jgi:hypothetical protein
MTVSRDPDRIIRAFIDEGLTELPDRVYDAVRSDIDRTRQRVVIGPWRTPSMNSFAKILIAAAAVVVVAFVGINLLPRPGGNVGGGVVLSPSPTPSPALSPSPSPAPAASPTLAPTFPPSGALAIGRQSMIREGVRLSIAVPSTGWNSGDGIWISKGEEGKPDGSAFIFWPQTPDNVFADPCNLKLLSPPPDRTAAGLATAVAGIPGINVASGPTAVTVDGHPAQHVELTIPASIGCAPDKFHLWTDEADATGRWAQAYDEKILVWIVDVDGRLVWIDGETYKGAKPAVEQELQQVIDSIQFE